MLTGVQFDVVEGGTDPNLTGLKLTASEATRISKESDGRKRPSRDKEESDDEAGREVNDRPDPEIEQRILQAKQKKQQGSRPPQ